MRTSDEFRAELEAMRQRLVDSGRAETSLEPSRNEGLNGDFDLPYSSFPKPLVGRWNQGGRISN